MTLKIYRDALDLQYKYSSLCYSSNQVYPYMHLIHIYAKVYLHAYYIYVYIWSCFGWIYIWSCHGFAIK